MAILDNFGYCFDKRLAIVNEFLNLILPASFGFLSTYFGLRRSILPAPLDAKRNSVGVAGSPAVV